MLNLALVLLTAQVSSAPPPVDGEVVERAVTGHFVDRSPATHTVVWSRRRRDGLSFLRAYALEHGHWIVIAQGVHHKIVDLQAGDIEHRGVDDVVLGLIQRSKLDVTERLRLFVYGVDPHKGFVAKWRGSSLSHPHRAFILLKGRGGCDLAAIERNTLPQYKTYDWLGVYRWKSFGLSRLWEAPVRGHILDLVPMAGGVFRVDRLHDGKRSDLVVFPVFGAHGELDYSSRTASPP